MANNLLAEIEQTGNGRITAVEVDKSAVAWAARLLGDTWLLMIICELLGGTRRFGEIQEALGKNNPRSVNPQTLSGRLKMLEHCGIITRRAYAEIPPRVEYELTPKGYDVTEIVQALEGWGQKFMVLEGEGAPGNCPGETDCPSTTES